MKKTLLAAALVTGFAGVAHAESSVTLYGIVDAGYGYQESSPNSKAVPLDKMVKSLKATLALTAVFKMVAVGV
ncbi:hypothetical protein OURE66S_04105 [Oligella ureolytica]